MQPFNDFVKGMTWGFAARRGSWITDEAKQSMREMTTVGVNWTALAVCALQEHPQATLIDYEGTAVADEEVVQAVERAHGLGLKVVLKPIVNCKNGTWRAHINFFDCNVPGEPNWTQWFETYERFILHYAEIAEATKCEMYCIGCEMVQTDKRENEWRALIAKVRKVYSGPITYNCDKHQEERVGWWDAVDIISSSGYYSVDRWDERIATIEGLTKQYGKPFMFMETGCPSRSGNAAWPNDWGHAGVPDMEEQAGFYRVMFDKMEGKPWFRGYMLWDWPVRLYPAEKGPTDEGYCIYGKKASHTVRDYFSGRSDTVDAK